MSLTSNEGGDAQERWQAWGRWLRRTRERRGLSKRAAAMAAEVSEGSWRMYENGGREQYGIWILPNPPPRVLHRIAYALRVDPTEIFEQASMPYEPMELAEEDDDEYIRTAIEDMRIMLENVQRRLNHRREPNHRNDR